MAQPIQCLTFLLVSLGKLLRLLNTRDGAVSEAFGWWIQWVRTLFIPFKREHNDVTLKDGQFSGLRHLQILEGSFHSQPSGVSSPKWAVKCFLSFSRSMFASIHSYIFAYSVFHCLWKNLLNSRKVSGEFIECVSLLISITSGLSSFGQLFVGPSCKR